VNILIEKNIMVPMRDGVQLATDVYRPAGDGLYPLIIQRLPYNKDLPAITMLLIDIFRLVQQGYAMLIQDTRGRFASEGEFHPFFQELADGIDTIARAASAPWSNGKVGLAGGSYFGATQWLAARETPEALLATMPVITSADYYESWTYQGGAFQLGFILMWTLGFALGEQQQRLLIGPWSHGSFGGIFPEHDYGLLASAEAADITGAHIRWYDRWLKGSENGVEQEKPVKIFVMRPNTWREEDDWPLPDTQFRPYYLHSAGRANTATGNGALSTEAPGDEFEDAYLYDPRHPVPTNGGATLIPGAFIAGPRDQRGIETREDVLCYTTEPLERPTEVTGPVELVLFASCSARDTDFTAKLVDVYPSGRAESITDGILRACFRESLVKPVLMEPNQMYELHITVGATSQVFETGHRIRLEITSSNFPRFDRNINTGGAIQTETEKGFVQALNRVYHDRAHPYLVLPIIERD